jgi:hypothetical protein
MTTFKITDSSYHRSRLETILFHFSHYKYFILSFSFLLWIFIPILGIFPLLFFIQLNILKPSIKIRELLNILVLFCVLVTLSIFNSSFKPVSDTLTYTQAYLELGNTSIFDVALRFHKNNDFVIYLIAYPIYILSNASVYWFLFINTIIINLLTIVISKKLSPKYYPTILIFTCSSTFFITQNFLMRQFLSNIFLIFALAHINNKSMILFIVGVFMSAFSHSSNIPLVILLLILRFQSSITNILYAILFIPKKIIKNINKKLFVLFLFLIFFIFTALTIFTIAYSSNTFMIISVFFIKTFSGFGINFTSHLDSYSGYSGSKGIPNMIVSITEGIILTLLVLFYFTPIKGKYNNSCDFGLITVFLYNLFGLLLTFFAGFIWRTSFLFISLSGLFYKLILGRQKEKEGNYFFFLLFILAILKMFNFSRFLFVTTPNSLFAFFGGYPLQYNIFDYLNYLSAILSYSNN